MKPKEKQCILPEKQILIISLYIYAVSNDIALLTAQQLFSSVNVRLLQK